MSIYEKLFELRHEVGKVSKNAKNPFYNSKYFDVNGLLEHIQPLLDDKRLLLLQPIEDGAQKSKIIDIETGDSESSSIDLPHINDPQKMGSAITYYRRYTLQSLLGLQAEDDDANMASNGRSKPKAWLNEGTDAYKKVVSAIKAGKATAADARKKYKVSNDTFAKLQGFE